jgi:hypothetical protein
METGHVTRMQLKMSLIHQESPSIMPERKIQKENVTAQGFEFLFILAYGIEKGMI